MSAPRLSLKEKNAILTDYLAGEKISTIAVKYGVHESYPSLLAKRRGFTIRDRSDARMRRDSRELVQ